MPKAARSFELIIEVDLPELDSSNNPTNTLRTTYLHLDTITERSVNASVHLATQPIYNGLTLTDHMYVNPDSYTVSGAFSFYGNNSDDQYNYVPGTTANGNRLSNIQKTFEYIATNGLLCTLSTYLSGTSGDPRFKIRKNMAIESISWNESESSMKYSITFKEVKEIILNEATKLVADVDVTALITPKAITLGNLMFDKMFNKKDSTTLSLWDRIILECLCENKTYIDEITIILARKFLQISDDRARDLFNEIHNYADDLLGEIAEDAKARLEQVTGEYITVNSAVGVAAGAVTGAVVASKIISIASAAGTAVAGGPIGLIIGACILAAGIIAAVITDVVNRKKIEAKRFKLFKFSGFDGDINTLVKMLKDYYDKGKFSEYSSFESLLAGFNISTEINTSEVTRLSNFLKTANSILNQISNNAKFYTISTNYDYNEDVECSLTIDGRPYKLAFTNEKDKDLFYYINTPTTWDVNHLSDKEIESKYEVESNKKYFNKVKVSVYTYNNANEWELLDGYNGVLGNVDETTQNSVKLEDLNSSSFIFKDASHQYYCYLYNSWLEPETALLLSGAFKTLSDYSKLNADFGVASNEIITKLKKYFIDHSGIAWHYLVQSYGTVKSVKDQLVNKLTDIISSTEV